MDDRKTYQVKQPGKVYILVRKKKVLVFLVSFRAGRIRNGTRSCDSMLRGIIMKVDEKKRTGKRWSVSGGDRKRREKSGESDMSKF